jgi:AcrR family transcriptional regulator
MSYRHTARSASICRWKTVVRETPDRILDAAERCMNRYGLGVSMRDVATEAGLSRGSLYRYFGDRETLVAAVLERAADRFVARVASRIDRERTIADELAEAITFVASSARRLGQGLGSGHGHGNRLGPTVAHLPAERETPLTAVLVGHPGWVAHRWVAFWRARLDEARTQGQVRADLDVDHAAEWITRVLLSFALVPEVRADAGDRALLGRFVAEMVRGLAG